MGIILYLAVIASSVLAVAYTTAFIINLLYMWPFTMQNLLKALKPDQVYLTICALFIELTKLKYIPLLIRWRYFYHFADKKRVIKDIPFGHNTRTLDLYLPCPLHQLVSPKPVVIYIFGGAYNSGDKSMYGLLCSHVSDRLDAIVCCPNYSIYPHGYMHDMVQDVADCIDWVHTGIAKYSGNRDQIMLVGFSAGAHLCAMTLMEFFHTGNMENSTDKQCESKSELAACDREVQCDVLSILSTPPSDISGSMIINKSNSDNGIFQKESKTTDLSSSEPQRHHRSVPNSNANLKSALSLNDVEVSLCEDSGYDVLNKKDNTFQPGHMQPQLVEIAMSIKGFVGLAGVYDIGAHFHYESYRGVENLSSMARAAYSHEHFDRLSPTYLIRTFNTSLRLPVVTLVHGLADRIIPHTGTQEFARLLKQKFFDTTVHLIPSCDHPQICLHLMDHSFTHHERIMDIIQDTHERSLSRSMMLD